MKVLVKNGQVVSGGGIIRADVLVEGGKIARVEEGISADGAEVCDAAGMLVFPGFIDTHTHLDMETATAKTVDDFQSGTKAAIAGGTTTLLDFATQEKGETLAQALQNWHKKADGNCACDYGFHMAVTDWNAGVKDELKEMTKSGVTSYKLYMAYDALRVTDAEAYDILKAVKEEGGVVGMHCENGDLVNVLIRDQLAQGNTSTAAHPLSRPNMVEAEAVNRYLVIAALADCPVNIVHLSTREGLELIRAARMRGQKAYIETCPQYLLLDDKNYGKPDFEGAKYVISPPLRKERDMAALWDAVVMGEVDTIGTDHCAFDFKGQKEMGRDDFSKIPNGAPGLQYRPQLMYTYGVETGKLAPWQFCRLLSENPARLFGMYPQKGAIQPGSDADIVVWDPEHGETIRQRTGWSACDYTPFEGVDVIGGARDVFLRGERVVNDWKLVNEAKGKYVSRGACQFWR